MNRAILAALLTLPTWARAWDPAGHMLVGEIAWQFLTPPARAQAAELIGAIDGKFNAGNRYNFTTAGCWMDDLRSLPRKDYPWSKWHYVDGPKSDDGSLFKLPEPPHIVWAIGENLKTLRDPATPREKRTEALGQLIHWVGDIHQPLHATTWDDRGGNGYLIYGVPFTDLVENQSSNLHTYWDKAFRYDSVEGKITQMWLCPKTAERPAEPGTGIIAEHAKALIAAHPAASLDELKLPADAEAWAKESHLIGCKNGYPPGEHPRELEVRKLEPGWVAANGKIAQRRIVIAGHRLAALLNEVLK